MKLRVAKKILKKQEELKYHQAQVTKATTISARAQRRAAKKK
jgi:hypothetical protein